MNIRAAEERGEVGEGQVGDDHDEGDVGPGDVDHGEVDEEDEDGDTDVCVNTDEVICRPQTDESYHCL